MSGTRTLEGLRYQQCGAMWPRFTRPKASDWSGESACVFQRKWDGHRLTIYNVENKIYAIGRQSSINLNEKLRFAEWYRVLSTRLPLNTCVDGEMIALSWRGKNGGSHECMPSTEVPHYIADRCDLLGFAPFAIPYLGGEDLRAEPINDDTIGHIRRLVRGIERVMLPTIEPIGALSREDMLAVAKKRRWEGVVLKNAHYHSWYRLKLVDTLDVVVIGIVPGKGKFRGMAGALRVAALVEGKLVEVASVSGMEDLEREQISEGDIGRVCEISHNGGTSKRRLRHPRFVRWRDDKRADECVLEWEREEVL